ncbi:MAG: cytochrome c [bacterium]
MTNAQKWVAAFLVIFVLLFVLNSLTSKDDSEIDQTNYSDSGNNTNADDEMDGMAVMRSIGCTSCHGSDLAGTKMAPSLKEISDHWNRNTLINYLRNPNSYNSDPRFENYKLMYPNIVMPAYGNVDVKQLGKMADYLLKLE